MLEAISLNERPSSANSRGPVSGARALRSPAASRADATRNRSMRRAIDVPITSAAPTAAEAAALATARIFTSSPMWNIAQPEKNTTQMGRSTASSAKAISWSRAVGNSVRPSVATRPTPSVNAATANAKPITA